MMQTVIKEENVHYDLLHTDPPINVLAVEDDAIAMGFLEVQIKELGHHMVGAKNGAEALEALKNAGQKIDVVLMDRMMPVMDGLKTLERMQDDPTLRHIPVIMVSGADSADDIKEGLDAGVFYYLTKPVSEDMLRSVLSAAIREVKQANILAEELGRHRSCFNLMETVKFRFSPLDVARSLAACMPTCFSRPQPVLSGLGQRLSDAM